VAVAPDLVEQALGNLVKQFANPMDCLRELVQNSIDAGTPRIEITIDFTPPATPTGLGELKIEVADFGQGMDAAIIDTQLTRLFSSAKEGDFGAIGKFGIGFTSVFAIEPALVRVLTGRHGENWEVVFYADRSFERRPFEGPTETWAGVGTSIAIFKRIAPGQVGPLVDNARETLIRWCEHAETPITFNDRTRPDESTGEASPDDAFDAFAAFDEAPTLEPINRPFAIDGAVLEVRHADGDVEAVVGYVDERHPRWAFFSGGLTLLRTQDPGHLGRYADALMHVSFKVRSRRIEHTLTRDNVIQDAAWFEAMEVVLVAAEKLRAELDDRVAEVAEAGGDVARWHRFLAADALHRPLDWERPLFVDFGGRARTLSEVAPLGPFGREAWLIDDSEEALGRALWAKGLKVVRYHPATEAVLHAALPDHRVDDAARAFALTRPLSLADLRDEEAAIVRSAGSHLGVATGNTVRLGVCDIDGAASSAQTLFVEGTATDGLFRRPARRGVWGLARRAWLKMHGMTVFQRSLLLNRQHPHVRRVFRDFADDPELAGFALAQAVLVEEGLYDEDNFDALAVRGARWLLRGH
jgi:hypothetical protein